MSNFNSDIGSIRSVCRLFRNCKVKSASCLPHVMSSRVESFFEVENLPCPSQYESAYRAKKSPIASPLPLRSQVHLVSKSKWYVISLSFHAIPPSPNDSQLDCSHGYPKGVVMCGLDRNRTAIRKVLSCVIEPQWTARIAIRKVLLCVASDQTCTSYPKGVAGLRATRP